MAYDQYLADRIRRVLNEKKVAFQDKPMMGGLMFSVDGKMLCGIHVDKKSKNSLLMTRVGETAYEKHIHKEECLPMDFTGRPMKGYLFITPMGFDLDEGLENWIQLALEFNPLAKSSQKRKKS
ncbi:RNA methyltransferase [Algoriphagus kandeliae]|uniref:RNA methyltransferase n=1 Tax=Algoriphagus kandeliae TaxID=2562278 RepID=A0A4Y9QWU2_9BACT|nr:TfoX/Sxy family protein [Algoriphagus kandeliae]TFV95556.1 RNA methyltransferase [Algoriphagus kandeliae]